jgi:hypothetical protein
MNSGNVSGNGASGGGGGGVSTKGKSPLSSLIYKSINMNLENLSALSRSKV